MLLLIIGLVVFLGVHSVHIVADPWRTAQIARMGELAWKGIYAIVAIAGFVLIAWGYGEARTAPIGLWHPPVWTRHVASLLVLVSFILIAAAYIPQTRMKAAVGHPMLAGTKLWALAHLLANGTLADLLLFGGFLAWAATNFIASRRRDRLAGTVYIKGPITRDVLAVAGGIVGWWVFAFYLHAWWIGVRPFG
ncbi:MAG: hypothetical protein EXR39_05560 [Betaproteobacteria bacterium]|nr:hypothetical protein [Betaproteobacteria bacterium]